MITTAIATEIETEIGARGRGPGAIGPGLVRGTGTARIGAGAEVRAIGAEAEAAIVRKSSNSTSDEEVGDIKMWNFIFQHICIIEEVSYQ